MTTATLNRKVIEIGNKIRNITSLVTEAALNTKAAEFESKILDITNLTTEAALNKTAAETKNKVHDTTGVITTPEFNRLMKIRFDARKKEAAKRLASYSQVNNAFDIANKNGEKIKKTIRLI